VECAAQCGLLGALFFALQRCFELDLRQRLFASCYSFPAIRRLLVDAA